MKNSHSKDHKVLRAHSHANNAPKIQPAENQEDEFGPIEIPS